MRTLQVAPFNRYVLKLDKADVYRLPYLESSGPGFGSCSDFII